ncbi:RNase H family protein [Gordonia neofelifaecis]|uniref:Ribonuclease HI n=1 Tax=Gordonia neofelifaecis NRRL B-59395 TaxID=644548 RepID=F1YIY8_9ACTN|nr:RNase H family protein [Gordonia neofelifaecis]EGD55435.1 ribonuclease HI [Gordonia neofelifaecis NRRL B-59395]
MSPIPVARPAAPGIIMPRSVVVHDVHVVIAPCEPGRCRYLAVSDFGTWSATVRTGHPRAAVLDAAAAVRNVISRDVVLRMVVRVPRPVPTPAHAVEIEAHFPGVRLDVERSTDRPILDRLEHDLQTWLRAAARDRPPLLVATDGSVREASMGYAWLSETGQHGFAGELDGSRHTHGNRVVKAELCAIGSAIAAIPHRRLTVLVDSTAAIGIMQRWQRGGPDRPTAFMTALMRSSRIRELQARTFTERDRLDFRWVPGHRGVPLNEGADALAALARRCVTECVAEKEQRATGLAESFAALHRQAAPWTTMSSASPPSLLMDAWSTNSPHGDAQVTSSVAAISIRRPQGHDLRRCRAVLTEPLR